jgi:molybdopterin-guanine dinucleotide biosynthesis protein A
VEFDALILAGGRSSRLGGVPKSGLVYDGATLLERSLQAAAGATAVVVVGPDPGNLPAGVLSCREEPPFAGPGAAIAAGLDALERRDGPKRAARVLILACDMPRVAQAVAALLKDLSELTAAELPGAKLPAAKLTSVETGATEAQARGNAAGADGVMAASPDGRKQPLVGFYGTHALQRAVAEMDQRGGLAGGSVFALLARLDVRVVSVPAGATDDVDTWDDATALGVSGQGS